MSEEIGAPVDLIRWTFRVVPEKRPAVAQLLADFGLEVFHRGEDQLVALWDEPDGEPEGLVEELWDIAGEAVEVTHEEFRRTELVLLHHEDANVDTDAA